jgi:hypothetical protein
VRVAPHLQSVFLGATVDNSGRGGKRSERSGVHNVVSEPIRPLHCYDFYQDYDEEEVDCGGSDCKPC